MSRARRPQIVCGAMAASVLAVNVIVIILWLSGSLPPKDLSQAVSLAIFAVILLLLVAASSVKRAVLKRFEAEFEGDRSRWEAALGTATILAFALREAAGLLGFALALLTGNPWWSWGAGGAALLAMFMDRPLDQGPK
ncbi:MAG TPA: hypothetical protein VF173_13965 [Thermoanaerobaculia bacterium]|nr:hypothetical protein [Thermoanaerobaculia bacterium]